jgi:hypothetical protein
MIAKLFATAALILLTWCSWPLLPILSALPVPRAPLKRGLAAAVACACYSLAAQLWPRQRTLRRPHETRLIVLPTRTHVE